jgi:hypothetical protein
MNAARKPIDLGGTVARNDARTKQVIEPEQVIESERPRREATRTTTVRIPESLHRKLQYYCLDHETTAQAVFVSYLEELLKDRK